MKRFILTLLLYTFCLTISGCNKKNITSNNTVETSNTELKVIFDEYEPTLDGAYAEKYAYDLYEAYQDCNSTRFIEELSNYDVSTIEHIIKLLVGTAAVDDLKNAENEFTTVYNTLHDNKELSEIENYIVYDIYTWLLYYKLTL